MELMIPQKSIDSFDFHTSPHASPPMTLSGFGQSYFSAPSSPSRVAELYGVYDEEISKIGKNEDMIDFDFQFCGDLQMGGTLLSSADDLFDGGKIRPLKSQPKPETVSRDFMSSATPYNQSAPEKVKLSNISDQRRGRAVDSSMSRSSRRGTRSLSPFRIGEKHCDQPLNATAKPLSTTSSSVFRKWKLKDFLLFRSASEGRASDKYPLKKFGALRNEQDNRKSTSFGSVDGSFGSDAGMRKKSQMSAHEVHYTKNKAASESLKKKTYLPYKQGIFARLF